MKNILLFGAVLSFYSKTDAQNAWLGQTKAYTIKENEKCFISYNPSGDAGVLILKCGDSYQQYVFDEETGLCTLAVFDFPRSTQAETIRSLDSNYIFLGNGHIPIISRKGEDVPKESPTKLYSDGTYIIIIMDYDLRGYNSEMYGWGLNIVQKKIIVKNDVRNECRTSEGKENR